MTQDKLLTVKFSERMLAEFHAAAEVLGARSSSALVHTFAADKIKEAKLDAGDVGFRKLVKAKLEEMQARSADKAKAAKRARKSPAITIGGGKRAVKRAR